jgi:hypothetical protein
MMMKKNLSASVLIGVGLMFTTSVVAGNYLADRHGQLGVKCAECHVKKLPSKAPKMEKCLNCHGGSYEELAKASAGKPLNPHFTHQGDKECAVCHKGHKAPEFFCNDCHKFKVQVP